MPIMNICKALPYIGSLLLENRCGPVWAERLSHGYYHRTRDEKAYPCISITVTLDGETNSLGN